jgi:hypothetical protein
MLRRRWSILVPLAVAVSAALALAPAAPAQEGKKAAKAPEIAGDWTGDWGPYDAAKSAVAREKCKGLDCKVVRKDDLWLATFEGECGRPYKYTIKLEGRQVGDVVLFKGTVDLGAADGGVFDWIGRATDKEFVGFYSSGRYVGVFQMKRKAATPAAGG